MMSVDYRGHKSTGYLSKITNVIDGKKYNVSTVLKARPSSWETVVLKQGFFGAFRPVLNVIAEGEEHARWVHDRVEEIVERHNPTDWRHLVLQFANQETENDTRKTEAATTEIESEPSEGASNVLTRPPLHKVAKINWPKSSPNTKEVLEDKAKTVASWISNRCDIGLQLALRDNPPDESKIREAIAETGAFLFSLVDHYYATVLLRQDDRNVFYSALEDYLTEALQEKGVDPKTFSELLEKRWEEYEQYPLQPEEKDGPRKGTLFWEFGKILMSTLGMKRDIIFQTILENSLLSSVVGLNLQQLLPDVAPRRFIALEDDKTGERHVISPRDDGFTIYKNRQSRRVIIDPNFSYAPGKKLILTDANGGKHTFTMGDALTSEIEQHVNFDNGEEDEDVAVSEEAPENR
jgi:hypothetical protein